MTIYPDENLNIRSTSIEWLDISPDVGETVQSVKYELDNLKI